MIPNFQPKFHFLPLFLLKFSPTVFRYVKLCGTAADLTMMMPNFCTKFKKKVVFTNMIPNFKPKFHFLTLLY